MAGTQRTHSARDAPESSQPASSPIDSKQDTYKRINIWLQAYGKNANITSGEVAEAARLLGAVSKIWSYEKDHNVVTGPNGEVEIKQTLVMLGKSIKKLEAKVDKKPTYAQAAQTTAAAPVASRTRQVNTTAMRNMEESRKMKSLIVRITNVKEKEAFRLEHIKDVLHKLGRAMGEERKPAGIRRLPSGDVELQMTSVENKRWAENHTDWIKALAVSAEVTRRTYAVMAHAVRVADIDTSNQTEAIKCILQQNTKMHKNASITRVAWTKKALELKKSFSSLIIETYSPSTANDFIKNGLIFNHEIKTCEYFCKESRILQCFNCHKYGHVGRVCRNPTRCGHCAGPHSTKDCSELGKTQKKYASCGKPGHEAWARECQDRVQQRMAASQSFADRPVLYTVEETPSVTLLSRNGSEEAEERNRKRTRSVCSQESEDLYGSSFPSVTQVESSAPQAQQQWREVLSRGRSRSVRGAPKRTYVRTKITGNSSRKPRDTQDEGEL